MRVCMVWLDWNAVTLQDFVVNVCLHHMLLHNVADRDVEVDLDYYIVRCPTKMFAVLLAANKLEHWFVTN